MRITDETPYQKFFFRVTIDECRDICRKHKMTVHFNWSMYNLKINLMMDDGSSFLSMKQNSRNNFFLIDELSLSDNNNEKDGKELLRVASLISKRIDINFLIVESIAPEPIDAYSNIRLGSDEDYMTNMFRSEGFIDFKQTEDGLLMIKYIK